MQGQNIRKCLIRKAEAIPPRAEEPRQVPTAEAKGFPNPAPRGAWVPVTHTDTHTLFF